MPSYKQKIAACVVALLLTSDHKKKKRKRRVWTRNWIDKRSTHGFFNNLLEELKYQDDFSYKNFVRMSESNYEDLLFKITPLVKRQDTHMRKAISPSERLIITLRFLTTGDSYHSLMHLFHVPVPTISKIIPEVCRAIVEVLNADYMQLPNTDKWIASSDEFLKRWNFPNCLGALDGKHVVIKAPPNTGSVYINNKKTFSIVWMALVNADYSFHYIDTTYPGRVSDGEVFNRCSLGISLRENTANLPPDKTLPYGIVDVPYVIVADDAFALSRNIIKPFVGEQVTDPERIFNYHLSRIRRISENAFGICSARFRVLRNCIEVYPESARLVVKAVAVLHNFLISTNEYAAPGDLDQEIDGNIILGRWRNEENFLNGNSLHPLQTIPGSAELDAISVRNIFKDYFMTDGEVHWQDQHI